MPNSEYRVLPPPTVGKHLLAHAYDVPIALGSVVIGLVIGSAEYAGRPWSRIVDHLPTWQTATIAVVLIVGAILVLAAIFDTDDTPWRQWGLERTGLSLAAGGWGAWLLAACSVSGTVTMRVVSVAILSGLILRALAIRSMRRRTIVRAAVLAAVTEEEDPR